MKINNFFILFIFFSLLYFSNFNFTLAEKYESIYLTSLNFQQFVNQIRNKIKNIFLGNNNGEYKEKYYQLLKKFAQSKLAEEERFFDQSLQLLKKRFPNAKEVKVYSADLGVIYTQSVEEITINSPVVDSNWLLVGKVIEKNDKYLKIRSLNNANFQFNLANNEGEFLGLARVSGLGYLIVDKIDPKIKLEKGDLVLTAGNDNVFPVGFLVGEIIDIETSGYFQKIKVMPLANFNSESLIIIQ